ncbi:MAG: patatin-like phospholipase family protein, partial [Myxococcales bacterium]|nr:patatin-like phospholipase family protein [Myxococcales bacterium]
VMSGGGARGAYEAGVVAGLMEVLKPTVAPFDILCGTSVGALNAAYMAAHAHVPDMGARGLISQWQAIELGEYLRLDMRGILGWKRTFASSPLTGGIRNEPAPGKVGRSLLSADAIERLAREQVPWARLHENVAEGRIQALLVAALHIASGRTCVFAELAPGVALKATRSQRRAPRLEPIGPDHILASAAIPLMFPARRVGAEYYCDGGVRFNTPIAPAIRAGAERLVVISLLAEDAAQEPAEATATRIDAYQSPLFLVGKVLNALLLDPLHYDLQVLDRFNRVVETLEETLEPHELERVQRVIEESRGSRYRQLQALVFRPSVDIGRLARERAESIQASRFSSWFMSRTATLGALWESDLLSFILFDADFAQDLIRLGRADTIRRADEIRAFFASPPPQ